MNEPTPVSGEPTPNVDAVLRRFFRQQMPTPWPTAPAESTVTFGSLRGWTLAHSRLLVGASLIALVVGYLSVSAFFPRQQPAGLNPNQSPTIGHRPGLNPAKPATRPMP